MSSTFSHQDTDNPITALQECFTACNLPHERVSKHSVRLKLQGDWQEYGIVFEYQPACQRFIIGGTLSMQIPTSEIIRLYEVIGRMNTQLAYGHFIFDHHSHQIRYHYALPEQALSGLDVEDLENLIEDAVLALESLFPVVHSLLFGGRSIDGAMQKYLCTAQGSA